MSEHRMELWQRVDSTERSHDWTFAVYDIDTDRMYWHDEEHQARRHFRSGLLPQPVSSVGNRPEPQ